MIDRDVICNTCASNRYRCLFRIGDYKIIECKNCGLVYTYPQTSLSELGAFYEGNFYEHYKSPSPLEMTKWGALLHNIHKLKKGGRLLEVGCSIGNFLNIAKKYFEAYGVEVAQWSSKFARENYNLNVFTGTIQQRKFPDCTFDVVVASELIEHLHDPSKFVKEVRRVLRKDGLLVLTTGNIGSLMAKLKRKKWWYFAPKYHLYYFSPQTIRLLLDNEGFVILRFSGSMGLGVNDIVKMFSEYSNKWLFMKDILARVKISDLYLGSSISVYAKKQ